MGRVGTLSGPTFLLGLLLSTGVLAERSRTRDLPEMQHPSNSTSSHPDLKLVCYYTNWSQYRQGPAKFLPEDIDPHLCTHIFYAFAKISGGVLAPTEWNDETTDWSKGMYERVNDLKKINPKLKVLLSVGGWNMGSQTFSTMVAGSSTRSKFITHALTFLRKRNFDGLDVDWEYPAARGSPAPDKEKYAQFLQEIRKAFEEEARTSNKSRLLLAAAVAAGKDKIDAGYDVPSMVKSLDFITLMAYDLHGSWDSTTGECSPLYASKSDTGYLATLNQDWATRYWLKKGVPPDQLLMGISTYGRTFTLKSPSTHSIGSPVTGAGESGTFTRAPGFLSFYEVFENLGSGWQRVWDSEHMVPYAYHSNQWVGYDDAQSVHVKGKYIRQLSLGGAMVWAMDLDDFGGKFCHQGNFTLIKALKKSMMS